MQTLDECKMSEYIPDSTSDGLREILLGCLDHTPRQFLLVFFLRIASLVINTHKSIVLLFVEKRIPASILLSSPWFQFHEISNVDDATSLMKVYLDSAHAIM